MTALLAEPIIHQGGRLRCPRCTLWARRLLIVGRGVAVCRRCLPAVRPGGEGDA